MNEQLTICERLKDLRVGRGLTLKQLAEETGLSRSALASYESDEYKEVSMYSIKTLATFYGVSTDYLLCMTENRRHPNMAVSDLHLSDAALDALKEKRCNPRLLSELIVHEAFPRLMVDIEVFVDGIAAMQIQSLNAQMKFTRERLMEEYHPSDVDLYRRVLESATIDEERYLANIYHDDLDRIARDIKQAHRSDKPSAPVENPVEQALRNIIDVLQMQGTLEEKKAILYCKELGIKYEKLNELERSALLSALQKSDKKSPVAMRHGKGKGKGKGRKRRV